MQNPRMPFCAVLVVAALGLAVPLRAQQTVSAGAGATSAVRVTRDRTTIWTRNPSQVLAVVPQGTVLKALSKDDKWYEVEVPERFAGRPGGAIGFVYAGYVELVPGAPAPPLRSAATSGSKWDPVGPGAGPAGQTRAVPVPQPSFGVRGFGSLNYTFFAANDSFDAIFGASSYPFFGGGGEVIFAKHFFAGASIERFHKTGQRVFVSGGDVFPLGLDDTVTITPITVTGGYRFASADRFVPYVGGGAGVYKFKEESEFADSSENVDETFTSYHVLAGVEYTASKWLFGAFEVQYTTVPDSLGAPGVSAEFDESNLGGLSLRFKVLVGR